MPKTYCCDKILENGTICGESDITKFMDGRYTTCKPCRYRLMSVYNKNKTTERKDKRIETIDPDAHLRFIIEDTLRRVPLIGRQSVIERIKNGEDDVSGFFENQYTTNDRVNLKLLQLEQKINTMQLYIDNLEKEVSDLKSKKVN